MFKNLSFLIKKIFKTEFFSNVSTQILGTGVAQVLPFLLMPVLSRVFNETDFANFTIFIAVSSVLTVVVGGRYQFALVIPKKEAEAQNLFELSVYITLIYAAFIFIVLQTGIFNFYLKQKGLLFYIPIYIVLYGIWSSASNLSIRHKKFKNNAISKVVQSSSYSFGSVGLSFLTKSYGLVIGKIISVLFSTLYLIKTTKINNFSYNLELLKRVGKKYIDYPKYGILPSFFNIASLQALVFVIGNYYTKIELGYFGLTNLILAAPLGLIGVSYREVFYQKIAELINLGKGLEAFKFFKNSALLLFVIGLPISVTLFFFGEYLFGLILGKKWEESGVYASVISISLLIKLVVSPLSSLFNATNTLKIAAYWQTLYFVSTLITFSICVTLFDLSVILLLKVYVVHELVLYSIYFYLEHRTLKKLVGKV